MIERQVFVTWFTPEEKMPKEGETVVITFSGKAKHATYDHTFGLAEWYSEYGWDMDGVDIDLEEFEVHAWCDLEPYGVQ